jgi:hypothetical protein
MMSTALTMLQAMATKPLTRLLMGCGAPAACAASASLLLAPDSTTTAGPDFFSAAELIQPSETDCFFVQLPPATQIKNKTLTRNDKSEKTQKSSQIDMRSALGQIDSFDEEDIGPVRSPSGEDGWFLCARFVDRCGQRAL